MKTIVIADLNNTNSQNMYQTIDRIKELTAEIYQLREELKHNIRESVSKTGDVSFTGLTPEIIASESICCSFHPSAGDTPEFGAIISVTKDNFVTIQSASGNITVPLDYVIDTEAVCLFIDKFAK